MSADFYDLLEVPEDASQDDVRDAFREKVRVYHPDHNDDPRASAQFTAVKKAYDTLGDPVERNAYDRMGHIDYVNKRLDGLPDPEKWAPSGLEDDDSSSSGVSTAGTSSGAASGTSSSSSSSTGYSSSGRSTGASTGSTGSKTATGTSTGTSTGSTSRSSSTSGRSTRTSAGSTSSRSSSSGSTSTGRSRTSGASSSSSNRRAASDGAGTATAGRATDYEVDPVVAWISRHGVARAIVGWRLLWVVFGLYALGLGAFARLEQTAVTALGERLLAAGTDSAALSAALEREAVPVVAEATVRPLVDGGDPGTVALASAALLVIGALLLPAAVGLLVYVTRTSPGWKPNYLYVVATIGPLAGIAAGLAATPPLLAELALFVALPLGALFVMLLSAFVRPRVLIFLQNVRS